MSEKDTALRKECFRHPCWEIRCAKLVWYISAPSSMAAMQEWLKTAKRPAGLKDETVRIRRAYEPCGD